MKNFEQIVETPEALGAFLATLPVADGPWDTEFRRVSVPPVRRKTVTGATAHTARNGITLCGG